MCDWSLLLIPFKVIFIYAVIQQSILFHVVLVFLFLFFSFLSPRLTEFPICTGLTNKKLGRYEEALDSLLKMHAIVRNYPPVVYQIASLYQELSDIDQASEWLDPMAFFIYHLLFIIFSALSSYLIGCKELII